MSDNIDVEKYTAEDIGVEELKNLIASKKSFAVLAVQDISKVVNKIEGEIEKQGLRCRVYTEYRTAAIAGVAIPTGLTQITGLATAIGVGVHNLVTINPDYEIAKNKFNSSITVTYKKG